MRLGAHQALLSIGLSILPAGCSSSGTNPDDGSASGEEGLVCRDGVFYYHGVEFTSCSQCSQPGNCVFELDSLNHPISASCAGQTAVCNANKDAGSPVGPDAAADVGRVTSGGTSCSTPFAYRCAEGSTDGVLRCSLDSMTWESVGSCPDGQWCDPDAQYFGSAPFDGLCQSRDAGAGPSDVAPATDGGYRVDPVCNLACAGTWICDALPGSTSSSTRYTAQPASGGGCNLLVDTTVFWQLTCDGSAQDVAPAVCSSADACGGTSSTAVWSGAGDSFTLTQTAANVSVSRTCRRETSTPAADASPGITCWNLGASGSGCAPSVGIDAGARPADWCGDTGSKVVCSDGSSYEWRCDGSGGTCSCRCNWSGVAKNECAYPAAICGGAAPTPCLGSRSACGFPTLTTVALPRCGGDSDCPPALPACGSAGYCGEAARQ